MRPTALAAGPAPRCSRREGERELLGVALAAVALIAAVLAAAVGWLNPSIATLELAALLTALGLGVANHRRRWHQRWIGYRLVEELWRKRQALARVGWSFAA